MAASTKEMDDPKNICYDLAVVQYEKANDEVEHRCKQPQIVVVKAIMRRAGKKDREISGGLHVSNPLDQ